MEQEIPEAEEAEEFGLFWLFSDWEETEAGGW